MGLGAAEDQDNTDNVYADADLEIVINSRRRNRTKKNREDKK